MNVQPLRQRHRRRRVHHNLERITPYVAVALALLQVAAGWWTHDPFWIGVGLVYVAIARTAYQRQQQRNTGRQPRQ